MLAFFSRLAADLPVPELAGAVVFGVILVLLWLNKLKRDKEKYHRGE